MLRFHATDPGHRDDVSGCTATTAVVTDSTIYVVSICLHPLVPDEL